MSRCKICSLKQDEHAKELWKFHQLNEVCGWCGKKSWKHSLVLWDIHQDVIPKHEKIATIQPGFGPKTLVKLVEWNTVDGSPYHIERVHYHTRTDDATDDQLTGEYCVIGDFCTVCDKNNQCTVNVMQDTSEPYTAAVHRRRRVFLDQTAAEIFWAKPRFGKIF